jgi:3-(3-hydroxy-phenyl)propionate hydroxylase
MTASPATPAWRRFAPAPLPRSATEEAGLVVVGGGPVGLTVALDLGRRGHRVVLLNRLSCIAAGSRAICFSKQSLETFDRLGLGDALVDEGVTWDLGKVFWGAGETPVYEFDLLPVKDQKRPAFINLQQYRLEEHLVAALEALPNVELRWGHEVTGIEARDDGTALEVATPEGGYRLHAGWTVACDGWRSPVRRMLGLDFAGQAFEDRFLIVDIRMDGDRPAERRFWFDPPFNPGGSALMHKQPDNMWRLDFQLEKGISAENALEPGNLDRLVRGMIGPGVPYEIVWSSVYTFQCRRMDRFVHRRVIFAGDSAHVVSPFGARGCNGGIADAANLGWKLDLVIEGKAVASLLDSYSEEAVVAADENILNSTRSTDFIGPKTPAARALRNAVLELAADHAFARPYVNSGRLACAVPLGITSLTTRDADSWDGGIEPGSAALDAPFGDDWLLDALPAGFVLLASDWRHGSLTDCALLDVATDDPHAGVLRDRYRLQPGSAYLIRPDQYVAARWQRADPVKVEAGLRRAVGGMPAGTGFPAIRRSDPDSLYARLLEAQADLSSEEALALRFRLILLLTEAAGNDGASAAISAARRGTPPCS